MRKVALVVLALFVSVSTAQAGCCKIGGTLGGVLDDVGGAAGDVGGAVGGALEDAGGAVAKPFEDAAQEFEEGLKELMTGSDREDEVNKVRTEFSAARQKMRDERDLVALEFDRAIAELKTNLNRVVYMGIDPTRVRGEDGALVDLVAQLTSFEAKRFEVLGQIDRQIAALDQQEESAVSKVNAAY